MSHQSFRFVGFHILMLPSRLPSCAPCSLFFCVQLPKWTLPPAKQSLLHLLTLSQSAPLQCLCFLSDTSVFSRQLTFAIVLMGLLLSARNEPLSPLAAALTFYNVAGRGNGDADVYHTDTFPGLPFLAKLHLILRNATAFPTHTLL